MSYRAKLRAAFAVLGLVAIGLTGWEVSVGATAALREATYDRLTAVRQSRIAQIERWFQDLGNHTLALAADESTIQTLEELAESWVRLPSPEGAPEAVRAYYQQVGAPVAWFPRDPRVLALQYHFLAANPHPLGHKDRLLEGPGRYGAVHARFHPTLHRYQSAFGFYDVLLVAKREARVVYTVFKEIDLGVSLEQEPYRSSALGALYEKAVAIPEPERYVLQDYRSYEASHGAAAAFAGTPVWRGGEKVGVLAIQIAASEIDRLLQGGQPGPGSQAYIVGGADGVLRSGPGILSKGVDGLDRRGEGTARAVNPAGGRVLRSHGKIRAGELDWTLVAEVDEDQAFAAVQALRQRILGWGALIALLFLGAASWLARSVTEPVRALAEGARRLGQRDFAFRIPVTGQDEIGQLAASFNQMAGDLERTTVSKGELEVLAGKLITAQEDERSRLARELHDDFSQRLAAAAMEAAMLARNAPDDRARENLEHLKQRIGELAKDVHGLSRRLHPKLLDELGLAAAIEAECRALVERGGPLAEFRLRGEMPVLSSAVTVAFYRIVQEGLRNVERHAAANEVSIELECEDGMAHLILKDDGRGFTLAPGAGRPGLGLASMEERARSLGGRLAVTSEPGKGTQVEVWLPCEAQTGHRAGG